MGVFLKSLTVLILALSTPLIYRQFANDDTIKFMSSYYSNYKSIDSFLRQSAGHLDRAKEYLPDSDQLKTTVNNVNKQLVDIVELIKSKASQISVNSEKKSSQEGQKPEKVSEPKQKISFVNCPGEDLTDNQVRLWTKDELSKYDGNSGEPDVLIGFLGLVYNVSLNAQHYGAGSEYNMFAGRDAVRAFITGNFTHDLHDDIADLDESLYSQIDSWSSFYNNSYEILGRLVGRYFDSTGCATDELRRVHQVLDKLEQQRSQSRESERDLPECNSEWNSDLKQGKVWCSTKSGGIERDWTGVPRIYGGEESQRCACFNKDAPEADSLSKQLSLYPDCDPEATECLLKQ